MSPGEKTTRGMANILGMRGRVVKSQTGYKLIIFSEVDVPKERQASGSTRLVPCLRQQHACLRTIRHIFRVKLWTLKADFTTIHHITHVMQHYVSDARAPFKFRHR